MKHLAASNILESPRLNLVLIRSGGEGGLVRKGGVWGWKGVFANPFAACYVKPTAKTMGGNGRRVGWYKANRASQERIRSLHPFFLSLPPPLSQFSTCSFHYTPPGYLFQATSAIVFSCLLILVLRCAPLSPLWKSSSHPRPLSRPLVSLSSLSLSHLLFRPCEILRFQAPCQSHALDIGHSSRSSETRFFMHFIVHWFFWLYIYMYVRLVVSFFQDFFRGYYYSCNIVRWINLYIIFMRFFLFFLVGLIGE